MKKSKMVSEKDSLTQNALDILPYALKFYGDRYKSIIMNTLAHTKIYELDSENKEEIVESLIEKNVTINEKDENIEGFYFHNDDLEYGYDHIVVVRKNKDRLKQKLSLTHELYGHAVLSNIKPYIEENGHIFKRNGLAKMEQLKDNEFNIMINEGIVEYITEEIIKLYNPKYKGVKSSRFYNKSMNIAKILFEFIGKDKMLELLLLNKGNINDMFNPNDLKEWDMLASELEKDDIFVDDYVSDFIGRNK